MDISVDLFYDDENENSCIDVLRIRRNIRDDSTPLDLPSARFISYFRLNKEAFCYLLDEIKDHFKTPVRVVAIPPILKLCARQGSHDWSCKRLLCFAQYFQGGIPEQEIITESEYATVQSSNTNMEDTEVGISIRNNIMRSF